MKLEEQAPRGDQLLQHLRAARAAQNELAEVLARAAQPQTAQDRQVFVGDELGLLEQGRFHIAPRLVDFDNRAVRIAARPVQHDLMAHVEFGPVQQIGQRLGARGARLLGDRIGGLGARAKTLEPADQFGPHAGWRLHAVPDDDCGYRRTAVIGSDVVSIVGVRPSDVDLDVGDVVHLVVILELGEQQRGDMLAVAADRATAVALRPRSAAIGPKPHPRVVGQHPCALHIAAERVAVPFHIRDGADRARLGDGVVTQPFRNPFPIKEN